MPTKVLVIEDINHLRDDMLEILSYEGFDVVGAENGRVGVDMALEYKPDLILCDIMMPEMNGYEVLQTLRNHDDTSTTPFIFLTAKTDRADIRSGMSMGANDYITKPFLSTELIDTIRARMQMEEEHRRETQEKIDGLINQISSSLPHELRTPLGYIVGFSELLITEGEELTPEKTFDWSTQINKGALRLYHVIENYLTFIRIESISRDPNRIESMLENVTPLPGNIIDKAAQACIKRPRERHAEAKLQRSITAHTPITIYDADLRKIIDELIDNAVKFSKEGQTIYLTAHDENNQLVICVRNKGRGMTQEQIESVSAYMQFDRVIHEQQGLGLGLIIAKRTAELYKGSLEIKSVPDEYTDVIVRLPHKVG